MTFRETCIVVLLFAVLSATSQRVCNPACQAKEPFNCNDVQMFSRTDFPTNFTFGAATSAYQIEGAAHRALNGWDYYTHRYPERVPDRTTGDLACNSYELYKEDVQLLKRLNVQAYRFSIAWSRVLPKGKLCGGVDENGIKYYDNLINELKANGIEPFVTIFHWDVPQALEDEYDGFLNKRIVEDYKDYAELLFQRFGDRVKFWITFNQPYTFAYRGYGIAISPPGRCTGCEFGGNSGTEPYIVGYHQLLAHATTVSTYRQKYKGLQGGNIGITLIGRWFVPLNEASVSDQMAAGRAFDFIVGWFLDPLVYGDYPKTMKDTLGERLPRFTDLESQLVKGSMEFLGLNYYYTQYATDSLQPTYKDNYENPLTYITENGFPTSGNLTLAEALAVQGRIESHCSHLSCLKCAIEDGCNVAGYFPWSSMDVYEFSSGYTIRFGMNWVNFTNPADRREKDSAKWYSKFNMERSEEKR
ncbi:PREDICTED: myrosinase 4 [Camelina sativa]|uniref:Myrosinase 4 n=1 Tax=Camelina sativa TaxID=90675 RepID=A0ABM1QPP3_CAMSA|nr:PREDICTED: myrosinase 4 [Camelina sativa]